MAQAVGARLREIRRARKVSQQRISEAVGLTQGSISNYEHGLRDIRVVDLLAILDELGVSVAEFLSGVPAFLVLEDSAEIEIASRLISEGLDSPCE